VVGLGEWGSGGGFRRQGIMGNMKIVIIGGVAAGMSAAARARRLDEDAEIVVLEKAHHVSFANCGLPYHIGEVIRRRSSLLLQTPQSLRDALDLDVRTHNEVLRIDPTSKTVLVYDMDADREYEESYDKLALCPGASAIRPDIPGIDLPRVHVLRRIGDMDKIKALVDGSDTAAPIQHAVIVGAGYIGLEAAESFFYRGVGVDVVEMSDQIVPPLDRELTTGLENYLRGERIGLHLGTAAASLSETSRGRIRVSLEDASEIETDLVLMSAGVRPNTELAVGAGIELGPRGGIKVDPHMRTSVPDIWAAGDAVETDHTVLPGAWLTPLAGPANRQGRVAGENMCGRETAYTSTQGTSVVKIFDMVAGSTGASEKQLARTGIKYTHLNVHPSGHAGYYPGTAMMHIKVLFDPDDGKLLGGQIVGLDGVDKRLDVLATAIRGGMTVFDLEELELAYAPPFGSAKDPMNMVGFVGSNVVRGDVRLWFAEDYPQEVDGCRVIDVRGPEEYAKWHIPGAENVPLNMIREASELWDRATPIRLNCTVGFRSYLAYRALVQRGFTDVKTLSGGSITFRAFHDPPHFVADSADPVVAYAEDWQIPVALGL
jgi:NADPH-dependent 2,4-dienoyl-CoA reductase/sulfur reductase-like enzyme/rhodanese-related sulfurtransferase